ncbi:MAG: hypothetical protein ACC628_06680 [Pirellulaceae bacterium]
MISLLVFAHFFFVFVAVSSNLAPSELQSRLLARFAFYTRLFNLDLNFTPYHLTHGPLEDGDHRIELLPEGEDAEEPENWIVLPDVGTRGSDRYHRYQRLAKVMSFFAQEEDIPAFLAQAAAAHFVHQRDMQPSQIRCRKHLAQRRDAIVGGTAAQRDPNDASYFQVTYDARCVVSEDGSVHVSKVSEASQVAQPTAEGNLKDANAP